MRVQTWSESSRVASCLPSEQLRRRPSACGREMCELFNTLIKSLPEGQLCLHPKNNYVVTTIMLHPKNNYVVTFFALSLCVQCSQLRCVRTFPRCSRVFAVLIVANATAWATVAYVEKFHGVAYGGNLFVVCGFATSHFDVIFMFPNQRIGEVC